MIKKLKKKMFKKLREHKIKEALEIKKQYEKLEIKTFIHSLALDI